MMIQRDFYVILSFSKLPWSEKNTFLLDLDETLMIFLGLYGS